MKRLFSLALGLGTGLLVGAYVTRRLEQTRRAVAPANLAGQAGRAAGSFVERLRLAADEGRTAAAAREAELREQFEVPSVQQVLGPTAR